MNLQNIFENELPGSENYIIEEGIFKVSPAIAFLAFKNGVMEKIKKGAGDTENALGKISANLETKKAKLLGKSGFKDSDTVYKLTKEQKEVMAYLYKKYGSDIIKSITDFRNNVLAPYQIIKRNVEKSHSLTNKEVYGMTKEEYYKYRESGRKKIEKRGTYFKDSEDLRDKTSSSRDAFEKAKKTLEDFKSGKALDLSYAHIDKALNELNLGDDKLYGWTERELGMTLSEINRCKRLLDGPRSLDGNRILIKGREGTRNALYTTEDEIKKRISKLETVGYNAVENKQEGNKGNTNTKRKGAPFDKVFTTYMLRRDVMNSMKKDVKHSEFKDTYIKVLEKAIKDAEKSHKEKLENYTNLRGTIELNKFEKKIWGKKLLGTYYSGNINDWYLKIKPEDFFSTKYYDKGSKVLDAEKKIDSETKKLERELKKVMSEDDVALCKKYRLFNNLLTVKQLKNPNNLFKTAEDLKKELGNAKSKISDDDFESTLQSSMNKEFNSIKDLEDEQEKIKDMSKGLTLSKSTKNDLEEFLSKIDPKGNSKITKISRQKFNDEINKILNKEYTGKIDAESDLKHLEDTISDFKDLNGEEELKPFLHDISKAKNKINTFLDLKENE